ncbi:MAG: cold-shock protein [Chloroflexota bacterium]|nr:cold-shock protein [Chloroflexota bacterium]
MNERVVGTVKFFNTEKGYGFIAPDNGRDDVFVHYSSIEGQGGFRNLNEGDRVEFSIEQSDKGPRAVSVTRI